MTGAQLREFAEKVGGDAVIEVRVGSGGAWASEFYLRSLYHPIPPTVTAPETEA